MVAGGAQLVDRIEVLERAAGAGPPRAGAARTPARAIAAAGAASRRISGRRSRPQAVQATPASATAAASSGRVSGTRPAPAPAASEPAPAAAVGAPPERDQEAEDGEDAERLGVGVRVDEAEVGRREGDGRRDRGREHRRRGARETARERRRSRPTIAAESARPTAIAGQIPRPPIQLGQPEHRGRERAVVVDEVDVRDAAVRDPRGRRRGRSPCPGRGRPTSPRSRRAARSRPRPTRRDRDGLAPGHGGERPRGPAAKRRRCVMRPPPVRVPAAVRGSRRRPGRRPITAWPLTISGYTCAVDASARPGHREDVGQPARAAEQVHGLDDRARAARLRRGCRRRPGGGRSCARGRGSRPRARRRAGAGRRATGRRTW